MCVGRLCNHPSTLLALRILPFLQLDMNVVWCLELLSSNTSLPCEIRFVALLTRRRKRLTPRILLAGQAPTDTVLRFAVVVRMAGLYLDLLDLR